MENMEKNDSNSMSLYDLLMSSYTTDELQELFVNIDRAMKYIHNNGFYINSFNPRNIDILDGILSKIQFKKLDRLPSDVYQQEEIFKRNILQSALLQIGIYSGCLKYINYDFVKNHMGEFKIFLPEGDFPYYNGVVERNAKVYLSDFVLARKERELANLEKEVNGSGPVRSGPALVKSNGKSLLPKYDTMNTKENNKIYDFSKFSNSAFISFCVIPIVSIILMLVIAMLVMLAKL